MIQGSKGLYHYLQSVQGYLAPPIFVVFFFGVLMKRLNGKGCIASLLVGFALGLFRLAVDTPITLGLTGFENGYTEGSFFWIVQNIYFQYYSVIIFIVSLVTLIGVSYMTQEPSAEQIKGLTFGTLTEEDRRKSRTSWGARDVIASLAVLVAVAIAYMYFRG